MAAVRRGESERDRKKEAILAAAAQVFTDRGFHNATVDEIARVAGVAKGTVYLYFPGKRELFASLLLFGMDRIRAQVVEDLDGVTDPESRLRELIRTHLSFGHRHLALARFLFQSMGTLGDEFVQEALKTAERYVDFIQEMLNEGVVAGSFTVADVRVVAHAILGLMNAGILWSAPEGTGEDRLAEILSDLALNGIARTKSREASS